MTIHNCQIWFLIVLAAAAAAAASARPSMSVVQDVLHVKLQTGEEFQQSYRLIDPDFGICRYPKMYRLTISSLKQTVALSKDSLLISLVVNGVPYIGDDCTTSSIICTKFMPCDVMRLIQNLNCEVDSLGFRVRYIGKGEAPIEIILTSSGLLVQDIPFKEEIVVSDIAIMTPKSLCIDNRCKVTSAKWDADVRMTGVMTFENGHMRCVSNDLDMLDSAKKNLTLALENATADGVILSYLASIVNSKSTAWAPSTIDIRLTH